MRILKTESEIKTERGFYQEKSCKNDFSIVGFMSCFMEIKSDPGFSGSAFLEPGFP